MIKMLKILSDKIKEFKINNFKFENVTTRKDKKEVVSFLRKDLEDRGEICIFVEMYERGDTTIIYSKSTGTEHVSISNRNRKVKQWEIEYAAEFISSDKISMHIADTGIVHLEKYK